MEGGLKGVPLEEGPIREKVQAIYGKPNYQLTGTTPDDLVRLVLESAKKAV